MLCGRSMKLCWMVRVKVSSVYLNGGRTNCSRSRCDSVMLMSSLLAIIKYVTGVDTRGKTGTRGLVAWAGYEHLIGGMGSV